MGLQHQVNKTAADGTTHNMRKNDNCNYFGGDLNEINNSQVGK